MVTLSLYSPAGQVDYSCRWFSFLIRAYHISCSAVPAVDGNFASYDMTLRNDLATICAVHVFSHDTKIALIS